MHPIITIFCPFTRRWAVDRWLENLEGVKHDPALTNLCVIIDIDEPYILNMCKKFAERRGYRSFHFKMNSEWHPNEVRLTIRRARVAEIKNQSKDLIAKTDGEYIICFEDDTVFERLESFDRLLDPLIEEPTCGFVEGVQMGRWGANIIGAWDTDSGEYPAMMQTMLPPKIDGMPFWQGRQGIIGGGFYGYATRRDLYLNHDYYTSTSQPWGPDVNYGLWLNKKGYTCLIDWSLVFGHNDHNNVGWPDDPKQRLVQVVYNKDITTGKWNRTDHEQTRY